jgi:hypothetical protein
MVSVNVRGADVQMSSKYRFAYFLRLVLSIAAYITGVFSRNIAVAENQVQSTPFSLFSYGLVDAYITLPGYLRPQKCSAVLKKVSTPLR